MSDQVEAWTGRAQALSDRIEPLKAEIAELRARLAPHTSDAVAEVGLDGSGAVVDADA